MRANTICLAGALLLQCSRPSNTPEEPPHVIVYAEPDAGICAAMCAHLRDLGCSEGAPTRRGTGCGATCEKLMDEGMVQDAWRSCVLQAASPVELGLCRPHVRCLP